MIYTSLSGNLPIFAIIQETGQNGLATHCAGWGVTENVYPLLPIPFWPQGTHRGGGSLSFYGGCPGTGMGAAVPGRKSRPV